MPNAVASTAAKAGNFVGGLAKLSGGESASSLCFGEFTEGFSDESVGVDDGRMAVSGGDGLKALDGGLGGALAA